MSSELFYFACILHSLHFHLHGQIHSLKMDLLEGYVEFSFSPLHDSPHLLLSFQMHEHPRMNMDLSGMSNDELSHHLHSHGVNHGPIVGKC